MRFDAAALLLLLAVGCSPPPSDATLICRLENMPGKAVRYEVKLLSQATAGETTVGLVTLDRHSYETLGGCDCLISASALPR